MSYADRVKEVTTSTGTGTITLAGAATGFQTFAAGFTVGATLPYCIVDASGNWETGIGALASATTLTRGVVKSSNGGSLVSFGAGSKDVFCTPLASQLAALQVSQDIAFATAIPLTVAGTQYMPQQSVASVLAFTAASSPVKGASVYVRLVADGTNVPTFTGMKEWGGSLGYDNRNGIANQLQFFYDGIDTFYSFSQAVGAVAVDVTAPTASSSQVANATPTVVTLSLSEAMDQAYVPAASAFTVGGHTVSSVAFASSTVLNVTVSAAFVNGEAARTLAYTQPGTNNLRDLAGNLLANFSGLAITNNVGAAATVPGAPTIGTATGGDASASVTFTAPASNGGATITGYTVTSSPGGFTGTGAASPITVSGLTNGTAYTFTATATNSVGTGAASAASNSVTPAAAVTSVRLNRATLAVTESASAPWTYTGTGTTGTASNACGAVSTVAKPSSVNGAAIFKVNAYSDDSLVMITTSATVAPYQSCDNIWFSNVYKPITAGGNIQTPTANITPATGDWLKIEHTNAPSAPANQITTVWSVSKDSGANWTQIYTSNTGVQSTYYAQVKPAGAGVLSCVSAVGFA